MAPRLVVVGNGMAGVRAIEEVLARGGGEMFDITVFGDEPYGNYNRILLSNVLAGSDDAGEIYLNAMDWYADNRIDLRAGVRVVRIDRFAKLVQADDGTVTHYDNLILATGSRSFFPPMAGSVGRRQDADRRRLRIPQPRRLHGHDHPVRAPHQERSSSVAGCSDWRPHGACRTGACTSRWCTPGTR